jgi:ribosomal protein L1
MFAVYRLPNVPRPRMSICILADAADIDRAKQIELEYMSVDDLKKYGCDIIWISSHSHLKI